jgi:hypothetical protein
MEPLLLIDTPVAGVLPKGSYSFDFKIFPKGGILLTVDVGILRRLTFGASYGGENIIGIGSVDSINWNPQPGVNIRYRLMEEDETLPALVIGFDSQGYGGYDKTRNRYLTKSKGFFGVLSKSYSFFGVFGFHLGANYSLETKDGDKDPNLFVGIDKSINKEIYLTIEYDTAFNDNVGVGLGKGYLNAGVKWNFAKQLTIQFNVKDILGYSKDLKLSREIKITYSEFF